MEVRILRKSVLLIASIAVLSICLGASYPTTNFVVDADDPRFAAQVAQTAEKLRHDLAIDWLGTALTNWSQPCRITVQANPACKPGGATTFFFDRGDAYGWRMTVRGPAERILDCVLPHEITHTIFATHFGQPLPRWADEGGATNCEHPTEKAKHRELLLKMLGDHRGIAFPEMFGMTCYPHDVTAFYVQAEVTTDYLIARGGRREYVAFLDDGLRSCDWPAAVRKHYGAANLMELQNAWSAWIAQGFPDLRPPALKQTASR